MENDERSPGRAEFLQWSACLAILFFAGSLMQFRLATLLQPIMPHASFRTIAVGVDLGATASLLVALGACWFGMRLRVAAGGLALVSGSALLSAHVFLTQRSFSAMAVSLGIFSLAHTATLSLFLGESFSGPKGYGIRAFGTFGYCVGGLLLWLVVPLRASLFCAGTTYAIAGLVLLGAGPDPRLRPIPVCLRAMRDSWRELELILVLMSTGALCRVACDWSLNPFLTDLFRRLSSEWRLGPVLSYVLQDVGTGVQILYLPLEIVVLLAIAQWGGEAFPHGLFAWLGPAVWLTMTVFMLLSALWGVRSFALAGVLLVSVNASFGMAGTIWLVKRRPEGKTTFAAVVLVAQSAGSLLGSCLTADILDASSVGTTVDWTARWLTIFSLALVVVAGSVLLAVLRWARLRLWATMAA